EFQARSSLLSEKQALESLILDLTKPKPHPVIYSSTNLATIKEDLHHAKPMVILSHIPLLFYREQKDFYIYTYESLSDAASRFYNYKSVLDQQYQKVIHLRRLLSDSINKYQRQLLSLQDDYERYKEPEHLKKYGDLLLANLSIAKIADNKATVI